MGKAHRVFLSLGSNIRPEENLPRAVALLRQYGELRAVSTAWESRAMGSPGPNFLNACVLLITPLSPTEIKPQIVQPVEAALGRVRLPNKNAPRTIDIDILMIDDVPLDPQQWEAAFIVVPLAELAPHMRHPRSGEALAEVARRLRRRTWIAERPEVLLAWRDDAKS